MTTPGPTPYDVLGVRSDCTQEELTAAYRRLSRTVHPDATSHLSGAARERAMEKMVALNAAYARVGNPASRRAYDEEQRDTSSSATTTDTNAYDGFAVASPVSSVDGATVRYPTAGCLPVAVGIGLALLGLIALVVVFAFVFGSRAPGPSSSIGIGTPAAVGPPCRFVQIAFSADTAREQSGWLDKALAVESNGFEVFAVTAGDWPQVVANGAALIGVRAYSRYDEAIAAARIRDVGIGVPITRDMPASVCGSISSFTAMRATGTPLPG